MKYTPWLIAHRGANREAPENTITAFDLALRYPVQGIETDIQMTKDGVPVLYHDQTVFKLMRKRKRVADFSFDELSELPSLSELLSLYAHRTRLMLEIKSRKPDQLSGKSSQLTLKVLEELQKPEIAKYQENLFVLSFDPDVLKLGHQIAPEFKYVLNLSANAYDPTGYLSIMESDPSEIHHLYALCVALKNLSENLAAFARFHQKKLMTYVCNTPQQVNRALKFRANVIMTDNPKNVIL